MKTFVIAEAGANHNRDFEQAKALINVAKESGADAVKFQTYSSDTLYSSNTPDFANLTNIPELIKSIELPREWQKELKLYCDEIGIEFMSTPFDELAVQQLVDIGVKRMKIAGFESTDLRFVDMVASAGLPLIVSLGIGSDFSIIPRIRDIASKYGIDDVTFLHCNNAYPTPAEDVNLSTIKTLALDTRYRTGISDHTLSTLTPALAVAAGATVVEKHFTLSKRLSGPDHPFALEPHELKEMIEHIRYAELCVGTKTQNLTKSEQKFKQGMRSVVAKRDLKPGDILTLDNITTKRPYLKGDVPAINFFDILGYKVDHTIKSDSQIKKINISEYFEPRKIKKV
jgi:sialic acid synthase SpsE